VLTAGAAIIGQTVTVGGWVRSARKQSGLAFIDVSDGSTMAKLQFVVKEGIADADSIAAVAKVGTGACVRGTGKVVATRDGKSVELECTSLSVMGDIPDPSKYPVAKARLSMEALREHQHLRPRTNALAAVTRVRNACAFATHRFFQERGFLYIHTPIITSADCEGAGEMFSVTTMMPADPKGPIPRTEDGSIDYSKDFFGNPAGLTVSGQLQSRCAPPATPLLPCARCFLAAACCRWPALQSLATGRASRWQQAALPPIPPPPHGSPVRRRPAAASPAWRRTCPSRRTTSSTAPRTSSSTAPPTSSSSTSASRRASVTGSRTSSTKTSCASPTPTPSRSCAAPRCSRRPSSPSSPPGAWTCAPSTSATSPTSCSRSPSSSTTTPRTS
ncbi:asnS, partial [Symbiodinium sp. KB8]